jgi:hypothetical protein
MSSWSADTVFMLGNFGCMDCPGPYSKSNAFVAYKNTSTSQIGWIKINFDLIPSTITLSVPEVLSPCLFTASTPPASSTSGTGTCGVFSYSYTINNETCAGSCNGSVQINSITGGTGTIIYDWSPGSPTGDGTSSIFGMCAGNNYVTFTDGAGNACTAGPFVISSGAGPVISLCTTNVSCYGMADGSICICGLSGGTAPYSYTWTPTGSTGSCITSIPAGTYTLCATDAGGCTACTTAVVNSPTEINVIESVTNESCFGCCDGAVTITPFGGSPGYTYTWCTGATTSTITGLCSGTCNYCVTDANGCSSCDTVMISAPTALSNEMVNNSFSIFPNPAITEITLNIGAGLNENSSITILNVLGQKMLEIPLISETTFTIDVRSFPKGIYFLQLNTKKGKLTKKFIKS